MSGAVSPVGSKQVAANRRTEAARAASPSWWIVFLREVHELWVGGRALTLLLAFSIILGIETYVFASNSELSLMPPQEMVYETLKTAITVSLFICMIIGADSISGERERATLEALLLTPAGRRQIVIGKFLADEITTQIAQNSFLLETRDVDDLLLENGDYLLLEAA